MKIIGIITLTGKHSKRVHIARLATAHASVASQQMSALVVEGPVQWGPEVNKSEQDSSRGHQMSLARYETLYRGGLVK